MTAEHWLTTWRSRSAHALLDGSVAVSACVSKAASELLAWSVLLLQLAVRDKVMAVEAGVTILTLLALGELNANAVLILPLEEPWAVMTVPALHSHGALLVEVFHACTVHLTSFFIGFDVVAILAVVTELAFSLIDEKDANSFFINDLLAVVVPLVLGKALSVERPVTVIAEDMLLVIVLIQSLLAVEWLVALLAKEELFL